MNTKRLHVRVFLRRSFPTLMFVALGLLFSRPPSVHAGGVFVVNSPLDNIMSDSVLTLRKAMYVANAWTGPFTAAEQVQLGGCTFDGTGRINGGCGRWFYDNITFAPSVTQIVLTLDDMLPVLIDAGTWINGNAGVPRIDGCAGSTCYNAFQIDGDNITISNLSIVNGQSGFADILVASSAKGARIAYNYLGTLPGATTCSPSGVTRNSSYGVGVSSTASGGIGTNGVAYIYGNVIGCHAADGVYVAGSDYVFVGVQPDGVTADGNWIGVNKTTNPLPNGNNGVNLFVGFGSPASYNLIANNVIAGNLWSGVYLDRSGHNTLRGNKIGVKASAMSAIPNSFDGVKISGSGASHNTIGDTTVGGRNIIAGNGQCGVHIVNGASDNTVDSNLIGLNSAGVARPNGTAGVAIEGNANNNLIGTGGGIQEIAKNAREGVYIANSTGTRVGPANSIYENGLAGVAIVGNGAIGNALVPYRVYGNGGLPIDLGGDGATPNGSRTPPGPNNWINYPVSTSASGSLISLSFA